MCEGEGEDDVGEERGGEHKSKGGIEGKLGYMG